MKCGSTSGSRKRLRSNLWIVYEGSHVKKQMKFGGRNRNTGYQQRRIQIWNLRTKRYYTLNTFSDIGKTCISIFLISVYSFIVLYFYNPFLIIENM